MSGIGMNGTLLKHTIPSTKWMRGRGRVVGSSLCKHVGMEVEMVVVVVDFGLVLHHS